MYPGSADVLNPATAAAPGRAGARTPTKRRSGPECADDYAPDTCDALAQHAVSEPAGVALARTAKAEEGAPVDAAQARQLLRQYGCHGCHAIPGVTGPARLLGPPLAGLARRATIAGRLPNDAATLRAWIQHPQQLDPLTAMPELAVSDADARLIASWLATLH